MLRKTIRNYDSCDASKREPLFLRVSPGGVSAISLTSFLRNGFHPQVAVSPTPLGIFLRAIAQCVSRFICDNVIDMFFSNKFISDNLQDEYAIDIYQRNPGRRYASTSLLMEYLLIPAQRDEEIEYSTASLFAKLPLWIEHIKLHFKRSRSQLTQLARVFEQQTKKHVWPNSLKVTDAIEAVPENHKEDHPAVYGWKTLILKGGRWMQPRNAVN